MDAQPKPSYDGLTDDQLELLILEWMSEELGIPPEGAPLVLIMLGGREQDRARKQLVFNRARTIELSREPERLIRTFELLDNGVSEWLATYLPSILASETGLIPVNLLQVGLCTALDPEELPFFVLYLKENQILDSVQPHPWGSPYEAWHLNPAFVATYQRDWTTADLYRKPGEASIIEKFMDRIYATEALAHRFATYLQARGEQAPNPDLMAEYEAAARALQVDVSLLMDAERVLLYERDTHTQPTIEARVRSSSTNGR